MGSLYQTSYHLLVSIFSPRDSSSSDIFTVATWPPWADWADWASGNAICEFPQGLLLISPWWLFHSSVKQIPSFRHSVIPLVFENPGLWNLGIPRSWISWIMKSSPIYMQGLQGTPRTNHPTSGLEHCSHGGVISAISSMGLWTWYVQWVTLHRFNMV